MCKRLLGVRGNEECTNTHVHTRARARGVSGSTTPNDRRVPRHARPRHRSALASAGAAAESSAAVMPLLPCQLRCALGDLSSFPTPGKESPSLTGLKAGGAGAESARHRPPVSEEGRRKKAATALCCHPAREPEKDSHIIPADTGSGPKCLSLLSSTRGS